LTCGSKYLHVDAWFRAACGRSERDSSFEAPALATIPLVPQLPAWLYFIPVLSTAVGGGLTLLGVWLGPWFKSRVDLDQWRRQQQLEAYRDLSSATTVFLHAAITHFDSHQQDTKLLLEQAAREFDRAASFVQLVAPGSVQNPVVQLLKVGFETVMPAASNPRDPAGFVAASNALTGHYDRFMAAAASDLGFTGYVLLPENRAEAQPVAGG
jgi:hypothetical protein